MSDDLRKQKYYERYIAQREILHGATLESSGRYGKAILALSGGALALTVTFLEKIAPSPVIDSISFIILAWLCFLLSVVLHLFSLRNSNKAVTEQIRILDAEYDCYMGANSFQEGVESWVSPVNRYSARTGFFSALSLTGFVVGVVFVFIFISINLYQKGVTPCQTGKKEVVQEVEERPIIQSSQDTRPRQE